MVAPKLLTADLSAWPGLVLSELLIGAVLGIATNLEKDSTKTLTASSALENVPSMLSPLAVTAINSGTLEIPLGVKLFIDMILEPIAAALISYEVPKPS